jgi:hypothetical protein
MSFTVEEIEQVLTSTIMDNNTRKSLIIKFKQHLNEYLYNKITEIYVLYTYNQNTFKCTGGIAYLIMLLDTHKHNIRDFNAENIKNLLKLYPSNIYVNEEQIKVSNSELNYDIVDKKCINEFGFIYPFQIKNPVSNIKLLESYITSIKHMEQLLNT